MKSTLLFCVVVLLYFADSCSRSPKSENAATRGRTAATAARDAALCDECICGECRETSAPLPTSTPTCPATIGSKWDLWGAGAACLRGVNTWQKTAGEPGRAEVTYSYGYEDFAELKRLRANYVNLSFPGTYSVRKKGGRYVPEPKVLKELTDTVDRLNCANLFAVVSFRTGPGRSESVFGGEKGEKVVTDVWESDAARLAWVRMWLEVSAALRDKHNVVGYDLMVEPVVGPEKSEKNVKRNARRYETWYALAGDIARAIRNAGDATPILVGGANASTACSLQCLPALDLPNIVYTVHQYQPYRYTHQVLVRNGKDVAQNSTYDCCSLVGTSPTPIPVPTPEDDRANLERYYTLINGYRQAHPGSAVAVNEFGIFRWAPDAEKHLGHEMEFLERLGANHAIWLWEPVTRCVGYDEFNFRHGQNFAEHKRAPSLLADVITANWARNTAFPDNVKFRPAQPPRCEEAGQGPARQPRPNPCPESR